MVMEEEIDIGALKSYSAPDILICGNCRYVITFISRYNIFQFWEFNLIHPSSESPLLGLRNEKKMTSAL